MDKTILIQYADMQQEVRDLRNRIIDLEKKLDKLEVVSDTVKGTRPDGTYGPIKITGYPVLEYYEKSSKLKKALGKLQWKELELLDLMSQAEEYIQSIPNSELRIMFRLYYIDGLYWFQVANAMNSMFPNRKIKYTDENCRKRNDRFFSSIGKNKNR